MSTSVLPLMAIFDLYQTLWPFYDHNMVVNATKQNDTILDKSGNVITCYPEVPAVFEKVQNYGIKIALFEYVHKINETAQLINMFGWAKYITYTRIFDDELGSRASLFKLQEDSGIDYNKTIFFTKFPNLAEVYDDMGFVAVYVNITTGMTVQQLEDGLKQYELKYQEKEKQNV